MATAAVYASLLVTLGMVSVWADRHASTHGGTLIRRRNATTVADLVILGGRVMDPESRLDGARNIAVQSGAITSVTRGAITGRDTIDARGLVVAPGFIDLHQHVDDSLGYLAMVLDGTTSAFDMEDGSADVDAWYAARAGRAAVNHGVAVGHFAVRVKILGDSAGARRAATASERAAIRLGVRRGLDRGAVGVGMLLGYMPAARPLEVLEVFGVAASQRASVHVHVRELEEPYWYLELSEVIGAAASTGAPAHVVHINSSFQEDAPRVLELLRGARSRGVDVSTEAYPYAEAMTDIGAAMFDGWSSWSDAKLRRYEWAETGERLTRESFGRYRSREGMVVIHPADSSAADAWVRAALADTLTMVASDGILRSGRGHPRATGTHARVLGRYVREARTLTLMDALRRMTLMPARRLEARVPAMRRKGRVAVGADADLALFDPATVRDRSTFRDPSAPSAGIPYVIVGGVVVVARGAAVPGRLPGRAIRAAARRE